MSESRKHGVVTCAPLPPPPPDNRQRYLTVSCRGRTTTYAHGLREKATATARAGRETW